MRGDLYRFFEENRYVLEVMADAYIASRYLPRTYSEETAERLVSCARDLLVVVVGLWP